MSPLARSRAGIAVAVAGFCMAAMGQHIPSLSGRVQKVGGTGVPRAGVRIDGAGSTETSDSGEFAFPLSGNLRVGYAATFHVTNWVIVKPCELKNGRTYLRDPAAEPIEILVLPPRDPKLKSTAATESIIGCLIEEEFSQLSPKTRSRAGPRSSLPKEGSSPLATPTSTNEFVSRMEVDRATSHPRLVEAAYRPPVAQSFSPFPSQKSTDPADQAGDEFLAKKAKELGFSVEDLKSALEAWTQSVEDPYQRGLAALYNGRYSRASQYISESLSTPKGNVLTHYVQLATAEYWQGHYPVAESALRKVLTAYRDDPIVLNNLAVVLDAQAQYSEAEPLHRRALAIDEKTLGPDHPDVARDLNNLALLYKIQGKYGEAEPLYKRALTIDEQALGPNHPDVATKLNNLAALYDNQGKYGEAEPLYKRALTIDEQALGPNHTNVARDLNNLALLYRIQDKYREAEPLLKQALAIAEKELGPDHPHVATSLDQLALLYKIQGKYSEAEPLYKRALTIDEKALGPDHPDVATKLNNLAELYRAQGKYREAEPLLKRALAIDENTLGPDHPDVATCLNNLAMLDDQQGKYPEAEPLLKRALAIDEKTLGPDHADVATRLNNLALLYYHQGKYGEAEPLLKRALVINEKAFGPDHLDVAFVAENLGLTLRKLGRDAEAKGYEEQAARIRERRKH
jgi:tetratricopeptide (TPR) repeat protein